MSNGEQRRERLAASRLYLVCGAIGVERVAAALRGGVDVVQLRVKDVSDARLEWLARQLRAVCDAHGALLIVNDRPEIADAAGADGVHVGQDDVPVARARDLVGPDALVGLSTHSIGDIERAGALDVDYIGVGPVHATPTKPGRPAVGVELVAYAAAHARMPWFAIGGIDRETVGAVLAAGAQRIAVVRAIADAGDVEAAARGLRAALGGEVGVGTAQP